MFYIYNYMKYIFQTAKCYYCNETNYYSYITYNITYCYICKMRTDKRYYYTIGSWDWA